MTKAKKTQYFYDMRPRALRRIWEDDRGRFIMINGERCDVDELHHSFFIKHQDEVK